MMRSTATACPNIAFIKYWGNRNNELRLPAADSLSMTLDRPSVEITVEPADTFSVRSYDADGTESVLSEKDVARFEKHAALTRDYLHTLGLDGAFPAACTIEIRSAIPRSIGLASSAAVFGCLARAYAGLIASRHVLSPEQTSVIARLGSGSAARSIQGGYVALRAGRGDTIDASDAEQIAGPDYWRLHDIVIIPSHGEKAVGSTEGHALAHTSPHYAARLAAIGDRQKKCIQAIRDRDFATLRQVCEEDALDMHHVMETSTPPLHYLTDDTHRICRAVEEQRNREGLDVFYTMDAGPTVHLICTDAAREQIAAFAHEQEGCTVFEASIGKGAELL